MKPYGIKPVTRTAGIKRNASTHPDGCFCKPIYVNKKGHRRRVHMQLRKKLAQK